MANYIDIDKFAQRIMVSPAFKNMGFEGELCQRVVLDILGNFPTADVVEVKHGEWKPTNIPAYFGGVIYECSLCGAKDGDHTKILGKYCWRCGAKMDRGEAK